MVPASLEARWRAVQEETSRSRRLTVQGDRSLYGGRALWPSGKEQDGGQLEGKEEGLVEGKEGRMGGRIICPHGPGNCGTKEPIPWQVGHHTIPYHILPYHTIPWQVTLLNRGSSRPWCGGTLINSRY